jgi:oligopeptidase A
MRTNQGNKCRNIPKSRKFPENVLNSRNACEKYVDNLEELNDLPGISVNVLREDGKAHGHKGYRLSLNPSTSGKCMQYLENERLCEEIFQVSLTISYDGLDSNQKIIEDILKLRDEKQK